MLNAQVLSDVVDMSKYRTVIAILLLGDMAAETVDFSLQTDSAAAFNVALFAHRMGIDRGRCS
jgi:hypothetical protein